MKIPGLNLSRFTRSNNDSKANSLTQEKDSENREVGEKLAVKDVQAAVPHFESIKATADLDRVVLTENKKMNANLIKSARRNLKAINFDSKVPEGQFLEANLEQAGADPQYGDAKLSVKMSGEQALKKYFKKGFLHSLFGWLPRIVGKADSGIGHKWLKKKSGINFYDPSEAHSHIDDPKRVEELLKSGRYAVSVVYKADKNGHFTKEPEAIVLVDCMYKVIDEMKAKAKKAPKDIRKRVEERVARLKGEELNSFCMINSALINPKSKSRYDKKDDEALGYRQSLLASVIESMEEHSSFLVPQSIFANKDARTGKYQYDQIPDMHFFYADSKKKTISDFGTAATLARNPEIHKAKIPEKDMAELMSMAMLSEHIDKPMQVSKFGKKMAEVIEKIDAKNTQAWAGFNQSLGLI